MNKQRAIFHYLLDQALDQTKEGEHFLSTYVAIVLKWMMENENNHCRK